MDIRDIAPGATPDPSGYWRAGVAGDISYPSEGHDFCASVEEQSFWFMHRNRAILEAVRRSPPRDGPILDVGAGNGYVALALQRAGFTTVAVEPGLEGVVNAVSRGVQHVIRGTLPSPEFQSDSAGAIGLFDVIEHVDDDREWLATLRPYLKRSGRLYITTPAYQWLWSDVDVQSGHIRRYSLGGLQRIVEQAGYSVEYATYIFWCVPPVLFLARNIHRTARPSRGEHTIGGGVSRALARLLFGWEAGFIRAGRALPFGGTCLLVARSRTL
jgi:SAM-dependent methyltransferase